MCAPSTAARWRSTVPAVHRTNVPYELARQIRASYYFIGALLSRFGTAQVSMPGGCDLGARPIDLHLKGFMALGANVEVQERLRPCRCSRERPARVRMSIWIRSPWVPP